MGLATSTGIFCLDEVGLKTDQAWEELVRSHQSRGRAFCCRILGDAHLAEDVYQEALLRIYETRHRPDSPDTADGFANYLFRVLSNLCLNELRRRRIVTRSRNELAGRSNAMPPEPSRLEHDEAAAKLYRAMDQLPADPRVALVLKVCENRSYAEAAEALEVTPAYAAVLAYRAKRALAVLLKDEVRP
jgi:RNA polymerase sigma factor (sigma-70 family)